MITYISLIWLPLIKKFLNVNSRYIKYKLTDENFASLWHKQSSHISQRERNSLCQAEFLIPLIVRTLKFVLIYIKGKLINIKRLCVNRTPYILEPIHIDICESFPLAYWNDQQSHIKFIDDYSRYGYLYLIHKNYNHWTCSKLIRLKLKISSTKRNKTSRI